MDRQSAQPPAWQRAFRRFAAPRLPLLRPPVARAAAAIRCDEAPPSPPMGKPDEKGSEVGGASPLTTGPPPPGSEPPSQFESFSMEWRSIAEQDNFDGFRIEAASQVTKYLQAAHTLFLGTQLRETGYIYQFGPVFQTEGGRTVMVARIGLDRVVSGRIIKKLGTGWELKGSSQMSLKDTNHDMHDGSVEYTGKDWTFCTKLAWQGAWLGGGSFTQRVLPSLQLGGDLTCVAVSNIMTIWSLGARWAEGKHVFTVAATRQPDPKSPVGGNVSEIRMQYVRGVSNRLSLGTEFKFSHPDKESSLSMAYTYTFHNARVQGLLDTDGRVSCLVSDFHGLGFSGMIDYARGDYKFGVLLHVMPPEEQQASPPQ